MLVSFFSSIIVINVHSFISFIHSSSLAASYFASFQHGGGDKDWLVEIGFHPFQTDNGAIAIKDSDALEVDASDMAFKDVRLRDQENLLVFPLVPDDDE